MTWVRTGCALALAGAARSRTAHHSSDSPSRRSVRSTSNQSCGFSRRTTQVVLRAEASGGVLVRIPRACVRMRVALTDRRRDSFCFLVSNSAVCGFPGEESQRGLAGDDDELNINPPTPCLGKRPQRPKPKGPGRPWGQKPLAHGRTVEGVEGFGSRTELVGLLHLRPGSVRKLRVAERLVLFHYFTSGEAPTHARPI